MPSVALLKNFPESLDPRRIWCGGRPSILTAWTGCPAIVADAHAAPPRIMGFPAALWIARPSVEARVMFPQEQTPEPLEVPPLRQGILPQVSSVGPFSTTEFPQRQMMHSFMAISKGNPKRKRSLRTTQPGEDLAGSCIASNMRHAAQPKTPGGSVHWLGSP